MRKVEVDAFVAVTLGTITIIGCSYAVFLLQHIGYVPIKVRNIVLAFAFLCAIVIPALTFRRFYKYSKSKEN